VIFLSPSHDVIFATPNANFSLDLVAASAALSIAAELPTSKAAEAVFSVLPFYESILPRFMVCLSRFIVQSSLAVCYRTDVGRMSA
jgi:Flp pilus assembly protein TadG